MSTLPWQNFRCGKTGIALNGAPRPIQPRNTPICSSHTSNSRSRENRRWRSSEGNDRISRLIPSACTVPSTRKRVRSYSLQERVRRSGSMLLCQLRFEFIQQDERLFTHMIRGNPRDDRCQAGCGISLEQTRAFIRCAENCEKMAELLSRLPEETLHPAPAFVLRPRAVALNIKTRI